MRRLIAAALTALCLATLGAAPAHAAPTVTVDVLWTSLVSRGAAVDVAFGVTCPAGFTGTVDVALHQVRADGLVASGAEVAELACGMLDTQRVLASITGAPFTRGKATLTMLVSGCDGQECFTFPLNRSTRITT
ncbi:MAG: hypothetical protein ABW022_17325 [Actinoplanes sp.]